MDKAAQSLNPEVPAELLGEAHSLHLAVHLHPGGFQLAVFDPVESRFPWIHSQFVTPVHHEPFSDLLAHLRKCEWTRHVFRISTLTFDTPDFALVPTGLIQPGKESGFLNFHNRPQTGEVQSANLQEAGITIVFDVPKAVKEIAKTIAGAKLQPSCALFFRYVFSDHSKTGSEIHVLLESGYMLMTIMVKGTHQLTNHFEVQCEEDILYFISHSSLRLGIDLEHALIKIYGPSVSASLEGLLGTYCGNVTRWEAPAAFQLPEGVKSGAHFSSIIHPLCAS